MIVRRRFAGSRSLEPPEQPGTMLNCLIRTPPMPKPPLRRLLRLFLLNLAAAIVGGIGLAVIILFVGTLLFAFGIPGLLVGTLLVVVIFGMITDMVEGRR